jgi:kynurenine formamidase
MYYYLSHFYTQDTPSYGNRDKIIIRKNTSIQCGDSTNTSCWIFSNNHIGTHIDVPYHFFEAGKKTFEIPVWELVFENVLLLNYKCENAKLISISDLEPLINGNNQTELILIKTGYEIYRNTEKYWNDNPGLSSELADFFRERFPALRCIGFDFISIASWKYRQFGKEAHMSFLCPNNGKQELYLIEDMSLKNILMNPEQVIIAPFLIEDGNGGPVTVIAKVNDDV